MNSELSKAIEELASKLGTTADHLWGVMVRQAPISGTIDAFICVVIAAVTVWWCAVLFKNTRCPEPTEHDKYPRAKWEGDDLVLVLVVTMLVLVVACAIVLSSVEDIVTAFANPEFWALKQILR